MIALNNVKKYYQLNNYLFANIKSSSTMWCKESAFRIWKDSASSRLIFKDSYSPLMPSTHG